MRTFLINFLLVLLLFSSFSSAELNLKQEHKEFQGTQMHEFRFNPKKEMAATVFQDDINSMYIINTTTWQMERNLSILSPSFRFSPDGNWLISPLRAWNTNTWEEHDLNCTSNYWDVNFNNSKLSCFKWEYGDGNWTFKLLIWDVSTWTYQYEVILIKNESSPPTFMSVRFVDNNTSAICYYDHIELWNIDNKSYESTIPIACNFMEVSENVLYTGDKFYNTNTWNYIGEINPNGGILSSKFDSTNQFFLVTNVYYAYIYDVETLELLQYFEYTGTPYPAYMDYSFQEKLVIANSHDYLEIYSNDRDYDGVVDVKDDFPDEPTQWVDTDNDGYGDNLGGIYPDFCKNIPGNSTLDYYGCPDDDGEGYSNITDPFPQDPSQWSDLDFDGYGDNLDGFEGDFCPFQWGNASDKRGCPDSDGDGVNNEDDEFPFDPLETNDHDGDGVGDNSDPMPYDYDNDGFIDLLDDCPFTIGTSTLVKLGCLDIDGDGYADLIDLFPSDQSQWSDYDNDGYGDNLSGNNSDYCPYQAGNATDKRGCPDTDNDGYHDGIDEFPFDPNEHIDTDSDGIGDNADPLPTDYDDDGYDLNDLFPHNPSEWNDTDNDNIGDNADLDDDNDCYPDSIEIQQNSNPYDPNDTPRDIDGDCIPNKYDEDIDGDGFSNLQEKEAGTNSYDNTSYPVDDIIFEIASLKVSKVDFMGAMVSIFATTSGFSFFLYKRRKFTKFKKKIFKARTDDELESIWQQIKITIHRGTMKGGHGVILKEAYEFRKWNLYNLATDWSFGNDYTDNYSDTYSGTNGYAYP